MPTLNKLEYLDETKHQIKEALNTNFDSQIQDDDTFRSYVSKISDIYTNWPKVEGEGTDLSLSNTKKGKMKVDLKGNTYQYSTTGKNKFDNNSSNFNASWDGGNANKLTLLDNGNIQTTADYGTWRAKSININNIQPNTTYTLSIKLVSATATTTNKAVIRIPYYDGTTLKYIAFDNSADVYRFTSTGTQTFTFTTPSNMTNIGLSLNTSDADTNAVFGNIQLETGTSATTYEKFTGGNPAPNPDYPQDIQVVSGDNTIKVFNKNILSGIEQGTLNSSGEPVASTTGIRSKNFDLVKPNTEYTVSINGTSTPINVAQYDSNKTFISYNFYAGTFTTSPTTKYVKISKSGSVTDLFQIEQGSTATTYVEHKEQVYPISLGNIELCKIGDYQDSIVKDNGKWYLNKQIGKKVFVGTENWTYQEQYPRFMLASISPRPLNGSNLFCSHYIKGQTADTNNVCSLASGTGYSQFLVHDERFSTKETYNTWLSSNNVLLYYVLATPTTTEITDTTLISQLEALKNAYSYDTQTNISQTNDNLGFIIDASALMKGSE